MNGVANMYTFEFHRDCMALVCDVLFFGGLVSGRKGVLAFDVFHS